MDAAQEVKSRLDIADIVGEYIPIKPAGSGAFKALCPFHQERSPSFSISRARQSWHCFGCDQGGDLISFVMRMEGMEFREALEHLANRAGVILPAFNAEASSLRKRIHEVNDLATRFFRATLSTSAHAEHARVYLQKRGVDDLTADLFRLGYAPEGWTTLAEALAKKDVKEEEMLAAGLVAKRERGSGVYDRFRNRLMFPIADVHGNIVGFTGRVLEGPSTRLPTARGVGEGGQASSGRTEAKYVNTPETQAYKKSAVLYGLEKAKGEIRKNDLAIIVEGNMDVVASHQFSIANVVAASGTALTAEQLSLLKRFTNNLAIAFDQDAAGGAATLRGLDLARAQDFSIKIITLPPEAGKDPDEAVRKDPELWRKAIADAVSIMEWVYRRAFTGRSVAIPEEKKLIARDVLVEVKRIADPIERDHWLRRLAQDLGVGVEALKEAMGAKTTSVKQQGSSIKQDDQGLRATGYGLRESHQRGLEKQLLALAMSRGLLGWLRGEQQLAPEEFSEQDLAGLYGKLILLYDLDHSSTKATATPAVTPLRPPDGLTPDETQLFDALAHMAEHETQDLTMDGVKHDILQALSSLRHGRTSRERQALEIAMREAERSGDQARISEINARFQSLN